LHDSPENTASEKNVNILVDAISTEIWKPIKGFFFFFFFFLTSSL
jgi:hypothetical protein